MGKQYDDDEVEIDLRAIFLELKKKLWMILAAVVAGGCIGGLYSAVVLTPTYTSTSMMYVLSKETTLTSLADLQMGSQLTLDYTVLVTSRPVVETVIDELGLDVTYEALCNQIAIENPSDTRILKISVENEDPVMAKTIVDEITDTASAYIGTLMEMVPPKIVEYGQVPVHSNGPSVKRNAVLGGVAGAVFVCAVVAVLVVMNDTIQTEEDVERYLGLSTLAVVPENGEGRKNGSRKKKRKGDRSRE